MKNKYDQKIEKGMKNKDYPDNSRRLKNKAYFKNKDGHENEEDLQNRRQLKNEDNLKSDKYALRNSCSMIRACYNIIKHVSLCYYITSGDILKLLFIY